MDLYLDEFTTLSHTDLISINGGVSVIMIIGGVITLISGIAACFVPGGAPLGVVAIFAGIVGIIAGIIW